MSVGTSSPHLSPKSFTIAELRAAVPAHCFERSLPRSFWHLAVSLVLTAATVAVGVNFVSGAAGYVIYWCVLGTVATGLWVIAHECGHGAFADSRIVNDAVGFPMHSLLFVPYWSWKFSHARHHSHTHNFDKDQVFVPAKVPAGTVLRDESAFETLISLVVMLVFGWPAYLISNVSGQSDGTSHFKPSSPIFRQKQRPFVVASTLGILTAVALACVLAANFGWWPVFAHWLAPVLVVNFWLVSYTLLHHTERDLPYYEGDEWNFVRGALSTVDRDYGAIINYLHHHIGDTHVAHHLFSSMPHYHAVEATEHLAKKLGPKWYRRAEDDSFPLVALWRTWRECKVVSARDGQPGVLDFRGVSDK